MWLTSSVRFRRASSSSLEMHSTLSLMTCSSESEKDDYEERFEDVQTPEDHDMHQPSLEEDQGNALMLFTNTIYVNAVIRNVVIDFALSQVLLMIRMTGTLLRSVCFKRALVFALQT